MASNLILALAVLVGMFLVAVTCLVIAIGARAWADAVAAAHRAHAHQIQVEDTRQTIAAAHDAVEEIQERNAARVDHEPPTDDELLEAIIAERTGRRSQPEEYSTLGNEGIPETEPIPSGGFYRTAAEIDGR